jgi:hypothetical protein
MSGRVVVSQDSLQKLLPKTFWKDPSLTYTLHTDK